MALVKLEIDGRRVIADSAQTVLEVVAEPGVRDEGEFQAPARLVPEVLLHLAGQVRGLVIQPIHELLVPELSPKLREILVADGERLGGIGNAGGAESQVVGRESPLEAQTQALQIRDYQRV